MNKRKKCNTTPINFTICSLDKEIARRRRVSYGQLEILWELLNSHKEVAVGYNKSSQAREHSKRVWKTITETLNSQGSGAVKDWKGWSNVGVIC